MISFLMVRSHEHIVEIARLAREIWLDHYVPIVGRQQVDYMLEKFQSEQALIEQLSENYKYYLVERDGQSAGYLAVVHNEGDSSLMLSKLYVRKCERGHGLGLEMLQFVEKLAMRLRKSMIWLTVNRFNADSIAWYLRMGFEKHGCMIQDIGGGFAMDDFRMEKLIGQQ